MMHLARLTAALTLLATAACGDKSPAEVDPEAPPVSPTSTRPAPKEPDVSSRKMLGVGAAAPTFALEAHDGRTVDLAAIRGPVILYFYPKDDTPG